MAGTLSLVITAYKRFDFIKTYLSRYLSHPSVAEVVIVDDASDDASKIASVREFIEHPKLRLLKNERNLGASKNKIQAVRESSSAWVLLMDSDNDISDVALTLLGRCCGSSGMLPDIVVCPTKCGPPLMDYTSLPVMMTRTELKHKEPRYECFWNTGNYMVARDLFLRAATLVLLSNVDPGPFDVVYINRFMVELGARFLNLPGFEYNHRVHDNSLFVTTAKEFEQWMKTDLYQQRQKLASLPALPPHPVEVEASKPLSTIVNHIDRLLNCRSLRVHTSGDEWHPECAMQYPVFKNGRLFEEFFSEFFSLAPVGDFPEQAVYIDVLWTNLYCNHQFMNKPYKSEALQKYIDAVVLQARAKHTKPMFFTVVQFDDGVKETLPPETIIYSSGGVGTVPLPLIYEDKRFTLTKAAAASAQAEKTILCSFVGRLTHPVRHKLLAQFAKTPGFELKVAEDPDLFIRTTRASKFALCPRGYGRNSFRWVEVLQLRTVPVYIYDDIDWTPMADYLTISEFAIVLHSDKMDQLPAMLNAIDLARYQNMLRVGRLALDHYSMTGCAEYVRRDLRRRASLPNLSIVMTHPLHLASSRPLVESLLPMITVDEIVMIGDEKDVAVLSDVLSQFEKHPHRRKLRLFQQPTTDLIHEGTKNRDLNLVRITGVEKCRNEQVVIISDDAAPKLAALGAAGWHVSRIQCLTTALDLLKSVVAIV